jgi:hypothetical protein
MTKSVSFEHDLTQHDAVIDTSAVPNAANESATTLPQPAAESAADTADASTLPQPLPEPVVEATDATAGTEVEPSDAASSDLPSSADDVADATTDFGDGIRADFAEALTEFRESIRADFADVAESVMEFRESIRADVAHAVEALTTELQSDVEGFTTDLGELEQSIGAHTTAFMESLGDIVANLHDGQSPAASPESADSWTSHYDFFA